jgi:hypothetical protein
MENVSRLWPHEWCPPLTLQHPFLHLVTGERPVSPSCQKTDGRPRCRSSNTQTFPTRPLQVQAATARCTSSALPDSDPASSSAQTSLHRITHPPLLTQLLATPFRPHPSADEVEEMDESQVGVGLIAASGRMTTLWDVHVYSSLLFLSCFIVIKWMFQW